MKKSLLFIAALGLTVTAATAQTMMPPPDYGQQPPPGYGQAPPPGYGQAPPPGYPAQPPMVVAQQFCQPYIDSFTMGGEKRITRGTACMHPDGSWELHPTDTGVRYVMRSGAVFLVPSQPFATVVVESGHPHHHHHDDFRR